MMSPVFRIRIVNVRLKRRTRTRSPQAFDLTTSKLRELLIAYDRGATR